MEVEGEVLAPALHSRRRIQVMHYQHVSSAVLAEKHRDDQWDAPVIRQSRSQPTQTSLSCRLKRTEAFGQTQQRPEQHSVFLKHSLWVSTSLLNIVAASGHERKGTVKIVSAWVALLKIHHNIHPSRPTCHELDREGQLFFLFFSLERVVCPVTSKGCDVW